MCIGGKDGRGAGFKKYKEEEWEEGCRKCQVNG